MGIVEQTWKYDVNNIHMLLGALNRMTHNLYVLYGPRPHVMVMRQTTYNVFVCYPDYEFNTGKLGDYIIQIEDDVEDNEILFRHLNTIVGRLTIDYSTKNNHSWPF